MPTLHEQNYRRLLQLLPDIPELDTGDHRKLTAPGFMHLSVDVMNRQGVFLDVALAHHYELNGDLVPDPDMVLRIDLTLQTVEALTYQDSMRYQVVYPEPGKVRPALKRSLNSFLALWLNNLVAQGHKPAV